MVRMADLRPLFERMHLPRSLTIQNASIFPPLIMAPMAGITHNPFRILVEELGGCGLFYTEMLSASAVANESPEKSFYLQNHLRGTPLFFQLLIHDVSQVLPALEKIEQCSFQGIDLNLGCTAPWIVRRGAGMGLMRDFSSCRKIIKELRTHTQRPLTAKIRLRKSHDWNYTENLCKMLENEGLDALIVHARYSGDRFKRPAKWQYIGKIKKLLNIPVIGNGDIGDESSAKKMFSQTGCDAVMIGRGAVKKPWVFKEIDSSLWPGRTSKSEGLPFIDIYVHYVELLQTFLPEERQLGRLKEFTTYFSQNFPFGHTLWRNVQNAKSIEEALVKAKEFLSQN